MPKVVTHFTYTKQELIGFARNNAFTIAKEGLDRHTSEGLKCGIGDIKQNDDGSVDIKITRER